MNDELKQEVQESKAATQKAYVKERTAFRALLLSNPNYFGNLIKSPLKPVFPICLNTYYEKLVCVGYHPQQKRLEAVVYIYQPSGYGTDICGEGTPEYVRFYLSYDNGATWEDQGITSFQVYNIPEGTSGLKRLEYAASLEINPKKKYCWRDPLVRVRAILSWNDPPHPDEPEWPPVWGNVKEAEILIEPNRDVFVVDILDLAKVKIPSQLEKIVDINASIITKKEELGAAKLAEKYRNMDVPVHRFAFKEISAALSAKANLSAESFAAQIPGIKIDPDIVNALFPKKDGDISYEELKCIGLDPNSPDTLVGVIKVKKPCGYSGDPCSYGSHEYVTFWADIDGNGSFETCLGTASVTVYDLSNIPDEGVYYAVRLPVDLSNYRQPCQNGPRVVNIRAILSWNVAVPCINPNRVPTWGNREETLINIAPKAAEEGITILGGIPVSMINSNGLTTSDAKFAVSNLRPDENGKPCPFGARVSVQGPAHMNKSYKVEVKPVGGGAPTTVVTDLMLTRQDSSTHPHKANPNTLRFDYIDFENNFESLLAEWDTTTDGEWEVKLIIFDAPAHDVSAGPEPGMTFSQIIHIDNTWPTAKIIFDPGLLVTEEGKCGRFNAGDKLSGKFVANDNHLRCFDIYILPRDVAAGFAPNPATGSHNTSLSPGGDWELETTGMKPCGYVIVVRVNDLAILNSGKGAYSGHYSYDSIGFCLKKAVE